MPGDDPLTNSSSPFITEAAFHEAIRQSPRDDVPRLVYADWLDEQGDPRGEFIRIQCERARLPWYDPRCRPLLRRERELLAEHRVAWSKDPPILGAKVRFERGFPYHISLNADRFLEHAAAIFELAPIQSAYLNVTDSDWDRLAECVELKRIRSLSLQCGISFSPKVFSSQLDGLCKLDLREANVDDKTLSMAFESPVFGKLMSLWFPNRSFDPGLLGRLAQSPMGQKLTEIHMPFLRQSDRAVPHLLQLLSQGNIEGLGLPNVSAFNDGRIWELLASENLGSLKVLKMDHGYFSEAELFGVLSAAGLEGLEELHLKNCRLTEDGADLPTSLNSGLTNLKALNLANTPCQALGTELLKSDAMKNLIWLRMEGSPIGVEGMRGLVASGCLSRFGDLWLRNCSLTGTELMPLVEAGDWGTLDEIDWSLNPFGNEGLQLLANCPHLKQIRKLSLYRCGIESRGAEALATSTYASGLEELNLDHNQIEEAGADALADSPYLENLQLLSMRKNQISQKTQQKLQQRFGKLRLLFD